MPFELFDPKAELSIREGTLPHWFQAGVTYFVTFRTEDSVPQPLLKSWHARREAWLRRRNIDPLDHCWKQKLAEHNELEKEYHATFTRTFMEYLDRSFGACALREQPVAELVAETLIHFDRDRYSLGDFVVMPNHVHVLVCLHNAVQIEATCRSWKRFSAARINRLLSRHGRFWQSESFDHLVRSERQFVHFQRYIAENPTRARLKAGEFLWRPAPK